MYDTILIPTDGSESATVAARYGIGLADAFDGEVVFVSVVNDGSTGGLPGIGSLAADQRAVLEDEAREALETLESLATEASVPARTALETGVPHETILSFAEDSDLLVMGTHGRTGLDRYLVGSVTERIVRASQTPVLTTHPDSPERSSYENVLIPTDGSDAANAAVDHGLAIAEQYGATVHALSVVDLSSLAGSYDIGPEAATVIDTMTETCERATETIVDRADGRDVEVVTEVMQGTPYRSITNYAESAEIDLITMGTHGRTGLDRYLVGSVTARVVRMSSTPVLTAQ